MSISCGRHLKKLVILPILFWVIINYYQLLEKDKTGTDTKATKTNLQKAKHELDNASSRTLHQVVAYQTAHINRYRPQRTHKINTTVVTAFFDIGEFQKNGSVIFANKYFDWAYTLRYMQNPLIVYTNSERFKSHLINVRNMHSKDTAILLINVTSSWAFQNNNQIKKIFESPRYPKFYPNTVYSLYTCAQHAKHDVLGRAAKENRFKTKYFMWLDVGYFRDRNSDQLFYLEKPRNFDDRKIAINLVDPKQRLTNPPHVVFKGNLVWVGGGLVFGERHRIMKFSKDFKRAVQYFLSQDLTNTDQQVIYAMYTTKVRELLKPEVELQLYKPPPDWFYLGYSMVREISH